MGTQGLSLFWANFGTHRSTSTLHAGATTTTIMFPYENSIAALSILFCRMTVVGSASEPLWLRFVLSILLGVICYYYHATNERLSWTILLLEALSYLPVPIYLWFIQQKKISSTKKQGSKNSNRSILLFAGSVVFLLLLLLPQKKTMESLYYVLPIQEFTNAYYLIKRFTTDIELLHSQLFQLLFVTFHIQVGMGFLGIDFLRQEQIRRNQLVLLDSSNASNSGEDKQHKAKRFQNSTYPFILFIVLPYMFQLIIFGGVNMFSFTCLKDELHRAVRLHALLEHDTHLVSLSTNNTAKTPGGKKEGKLLASITFVKMLTNLHIFFYFIK
jgi:hypothetical protein